MLKLSDRGLEFISKHEGFVPFTYDDLVAPTRPWRPEEERQGTLTIGYGHTTNATMPDGTPRRITEAQGLDLLRADVEVAESGVRRLTAGLIGDRPLRQNEFDALVSFTFNVGEYALQRSTLLDAVREGDAKAVANEFPRWRMSKGRVLQGLVRRRAEEADLFRRNKCDPTIC